MSDPVDLEEALCGTCGLSRVSCFHPWTLGQAHPVSLGVATIPAMPNSPHPTLITPSLIEAIRSRYALDWNGIHGVSHWARVRNNGFKLAAQNGANRQVVELFAFLHDSCRLNDGYDREHGRRAARFAESLLDTHIFLPDHDFELLVHACTNHTWGNTVADITVQTCWDADRLDLGRIGTIPDPLRLCTSAARDPSMIKWAYQHSIG